MIILFLSFCTLQIFQTSHLCPLSLLAHHSLSLSPSESPAGLLTHWTVTYPLVIVKSEKQEILELEDIFDTSVLSFYKGRAHIQFHTTSGLICLDLPCNI